MKCFNHPERDGIAICLACGKSLCHECGNETGGIIACHQRCTEELQKRKTLFSELEAHLKSVGRANLLSAFFSIIMGILFILFANMGFGIVYDFILFLGIGFAAYGIMALLTWMIIFLKQRRKEHSN